MHGAGLCTDKAVASGLAKTSTWLTALQWFGKLPEYRFGVNVTHIPINRVDPYRLLRLERLRLSRKWVTVITHACTHVRTVDSLTCILACTHILTTNTRLTNSLILATRIICTIFSMFDLPFACVPQTRLLAPEGAGCSVATEEKRNTSFAESFPQ